MYDVIIVGGGPGGYLAAERSGARGFSTLLIEERELGGVCLNEGCIPTKTLLNSAKHYLYGLESEKYGVTFENPVFNLAAAMKWKNRVIQTLVKGVAYQMKRHHVEVVKGRGIFTDRNRIEVDGTAYEGKNIIIASGSSSAVPPIPGADMDHVLTSREILMIEKMPDSLTVIGGGVIGMEFASFFSSFGMQVHVIEMMDEIVPFMDRELAQMLRKEMKGKIDFHLGCRVEKIDSGKVYYSDTAGEQKHVTADMVLMAAGRRPNVSDMGLDKIGLDFSSKGIRVDEMMCTNLPNVYAVGDVTGESLLAHSAYRMGEVAVNHIAGVGMTEAQAEARGRSIKTAALQMRANGRFLAENPGKNGICKVIVDAERDTLLGVHMLGGYSSEIIYGAAAMIEAELRVRDVKEIIFPHPTVSEIIKDTLWELN